MPSATRFVNYAVLAALIALLFLLWIARDIVTLFLLAALAAYLADPLASAMSRHGLSRSLAAALLVFGLVVCAVVVFAALSSTLLSQLDGMLSVLQSVSTDALNRIRRYLLQFLPMLREVGLDGLVKAPRAPSDAGVAEPLAVAMATGGVVFAKIVGFALLLPILSFYLLKDWPQLWSGLVHAASARYRAKLRALGHELDQILTAFLRGQALVCLCMMVLYSMGFFAVGLDYALLVGSVAGLLKFLPYVGTVIAVAIAGATAIGQSNSDLWLFGGIGLTFLIGEAIESGILSPKIIGDRVRMPPPLVIFAVLIGGQVLGIIGIFVAVPAFAAGRAMVLFWLREQAAQERAAAALVEAQGAHK